MSGEAASADITVANEFPIYFQNLVDEEKLTPNLVFNVDETGLLRVMVKSFQRKI
jgi:hypothetical protein